MAALRCNKRGSWFSRGSCTQHLHVQNDTHRVLEAVDPVFARSAGNTISNFEIALADDGSLQRASDSVCNISA